MRATSRGVALIAVALVGSIVFVPPVQAHAVLVGSDPSDGSVLPNAPATADLWFNEDVAPDFSSGQLLDAGGRSIPGIRIAPDPQDPRHLAFELPPLEAGAYGVLWRVLAEDDGHTTSGVVVFSVGAGSTPALAALPATGSNSPLDAALRWVRICLLALIVGGLGMVLLVLDRSRGRTDEPLAGSIGSAKRRILVVVLAASGVAIGAGLVALLVQARRLLGTGPSDGGLAHLLVSTRTGNLWLVREIALVSMAGLTLAMLRRSRASARTGSRLGAAAGGAVVVIVAVEALGSHAASVGSGAPTALVADSVHVLTALLWIGLLPALVLALWPSTGGAGRAELIRACRGPFSRLAVTSVLLIVVTGLYGAGREVRTTDDLFGTPYGRILLVKTGLLLVIGGIGLLNSIRLHGWHPAWLGPARRWFDRPPTRRLIATEAAVGAILLLAAGLLADTPPALASRASAPLIPAARQDLYGSVDDLVVSVSVTPNRPGVNGFTAIVASSRRPPPAPVDGVHLTLVQGRTGQTPGTTMRLQEVEPGRYFGSERLGRPGPWHLTVVIRRAGERLHIPLSWSVADVAAPTAIAPSGRRLAPIVNTIAASLLTIVVVIVLATRRRRGRPDRNRREPIQRVAAGPAPAPGDDALEETRATVPT